MNRFPLLRGFWQPKPAGKSICNKYHRAPCFWSGFWWLLIRDNPWMRWVNSGCFMDFLVLFLVILWILCLFRCLKHSALGKMPCATICCTCKKQLTARDSSWSQAYKKNHTEIHQHRADFQQQKTSFLPLELPFWWENSWEIHQLLVRFYEEITQKGGPNRNHEATLGGYHRYPKEHLGTTMSPRKVISGIFRQIMDIQTCINMSQVIWNHFQNPSLHLT